MKEVNWDELEFRCHYFGELMMPAKGKSNMELFKEANIAYDKQYAKVDSMKDGPAKEKAFAKLFDQNDRLNELNAIKDIPKFGGTALRRLSQIYTEETTGRKKNITSLTIEKGLMTEEDSITLYSLKSGLYYRKNKVRLSNGFVSGEWDFEDEEQDMIIDTKSSWDVFTFDATVAAGLNPMYEWQGQMYMWLRGRKRHRIAYCLNNTPKKIVDKLKYRAKMDFEGTQEELDELYNKIEFENNYDDLPLDRKIRVYDVNRDEEKIELAKSYIPHFRNYLKNFESNKTQIYGSYENSESSISEESVDNS